MLRQTIETIYGIHAVSLALQSGSGIRLHLRDGQLNQRQQALLELANTMGCPVTRDFEAPGHASDSFAHQDVALEVCAPEFRLEAALIPDLAMADNPLVLVLDGVTDPRNFGACLRSAASFGATAVVVPKDRSAPLSEAAVKTASGAAYVVPVYRVTNLVRCLNSMKKAGLWVVGTVLETSQTLSETDLTGPIVLVMGSEGAGLRQKTRENCDFLAQIPAPMPDFSLNVSVATGISLYEVNRQRIA